MGTLIGKGFMLRIVMIVVCMLVSGINNIYIAVGITFVLFLGYLLFMFAEGSQVGEDQCTMTDTVRKIREQGKTPTQDQLKRCFNPKNGLIACAVLAAPGLILAILNLITADPTSAKTGVIGVITRIWFLPEVFVTRICTELVKTNIDGAVSAAAGVLQSLKGGIINTDALIAKTGALSGVYTYVTDYSPLRLLNILYIPLALLPPVAQLIGYLRGPKLRAKTLNDMMKGSNRKLRRMRKTRSHQPRVQKPEI